MYSRLGLSANWSCKNVTKALDYCRAGSSRQDSIIIAERFHGSSPGIVISSKTRESNSAYAVFLADCKSLQSDSNELRRRVKRQLLNSNLESLPSWRRNKFAEVTDKERCKRRRSTREFLSSGRSFLEKYRYVTYKCNERWVSLYYLLIIRFANLFPLVKLAIISESSIFTLIMCKIR